LWPNVFEKIPASAFSEDRKKMLCSCQDCTLMTLGDGFLVPGHQTGSINIQPVHASGMPNVDAIKIATEEFFGITILPSGSILTEMVFWILFQHAHILITLDPPRESLCGSSNLTAQMPLLLLGK
jgi:hypothetical protein